MNQGGVLQGGVLQGGVPSPTLFTVYTADSPTPHTHSRRVTKRLQVSIGQPRELQKEVEDEGKLTEELSNPNPRKESTTTGGRHPDEQETR